MDRTRIIAADMLEEAGMELRQWECNLLSARSISSFSWSVDDDGSHTTKVLGKVWNKEKDMLAVEIPKKEEFMKDSITKRSALAMISRIFDPLGILTPAMIVPKLIVQNAFIKKTDWDSELDEEDKAQI